MVAKARGGVSLKVAAPVFEARLIKTLVQYLRWEGEEEEEGENFDDPRDGRRPRPDLYRDLSCCRQSAVAWFASRALQTGSLAD
ncbi:hypothetical protein EYF80_043666 [Liparis tanakae]|uniref:Uncharacterized protein n=1 Tax=Liparis tanakae TaxID=230148 RepID=A0A4Z2FYZ4_9TELE|nr:hypothetical protein EYF80_043666 [Liparis tanakae]